MTQALPQETVDLVRAGRISDDPVPLGQGAEMTFLHADGSSHSSFNENSLVLRLDLGEVTCPTARIYPESGGRRE